MKLLIAASLTVGALLAGAFIAQAAPRPKISAAQAEAAAARALHGRAVSAKYEHEDGRWQYAVIVMKGKAMYEVEVSATTGKVLDSERTSAAEEASEAAADARAAARANHHSR